MITKSFEKFVESISSEKFSIVKDAILNNQDILTKYVVGLPEHTPDTPVTPIDITDDGVVELNISGNNYETKLEWVEEILYESSNLYFDYPPDEEVKPEKQWKKDDNFRKLLKQHKSLSNLIKLIKRTKNIDYSYCKTIDDLYLNLKGDRLLEGLTHKQFDVIDELGFSVVEEVDIQEYTFVLVELSSSIARMVGADYQVGIQKAGYEFTDYNHQFLELPIDRIPISVYRKVLEILKKWTKKHDKIAVGSVNPKKQERYKRILQNSGFVVSETSTQGIFIVSI